MNFRHRQWTLSHVWLGFVLLAVGLLPAADAISAENAKPETLEQFESFLKASLEKKSVDETGVRAFYEHAFSFWIDQKQAYWQYPDRYKTLLPLYYQAQTIYQDATANDIERFKDSIELFQRFDARNTLPSRPVLFVGSSSIVFWETATAFPNYPVINRGFGGASLTEVNHYYYQVVKKYNPAVVIVYCDIDVEMRKPPEVALGYFKEFSAKVTKDFPAAQIIFLSMKPTLMDDFLGQDVAKNKVIANRLFKAFAENEQNIHFVDVATPMLQPDGRVKPNIFRDDGMHLNAKGYDIWNPIIRRYLASTYEK